MRRLLRACAALLLVAGAWGSGVARAEPVVFAAASLKEALDAASGAFVRIRGGPRPVVSYAASSALARQIEQGAPAEVFLSADEDWMDHLERRGQLQPGSRTALLRNRLVLIAPASGASAGAVSAMRLAPGAPLAAALGPDGRLAVGDVAAVPAGRYAKAALESLGLWPSVSARLAQAENVRVALALVARGEAPLGIVYATDARAEPKVRVVDTFPEWSHPPIVHSVALTAGARSPRARAFVDFLRSPEGLAVFSAHGFQAAAR